MSSTMSKRRLMKEMKKFEKDAVEGLELQEVEDVNCWTVKLTGAPESLYEGEEYLLQVKFDSSYPIDPPEIKFVGDKVPLHEHVYSNGFLCLSVLYSDGEYSPALSIQALCLSILSMLSSATEKKAPPDDDSLSRSRVKDARTVSWDFHDDSC